MKPKQSEGFTPFNHGYLCQMLKNATPQQLADVMEDVTKEQARRLRESETQYTMQLRDLITKIVNDGFYIKISTNTGICSIFNNNIDSLSISIDYDSAL